DPWTLAAFIPAALALNLTPGADMMFCLAQGLRGGPRAAVSASAGVSAGSMTNVALAGLGLGALVASLPHLFDAIRWVGVAYLLYLAWHTLRTPLTVRGSAPVKPSRGFRDGYLVNVTNPKVILFILAFIPQFVDPSRGPVLMQFLIFGAVIAIGGGVINALVGIGAGRIGGSLARNARFDLILRRASASVFGALAVKLAWDSRT
ncbi:MAG: LysE family translocator, partial [Rhodobacteraceae bacterium]|nr:LysE family translocator [Paracoccaceae bacterium]